MVENRMVNNPISKLSLLSLSYWCSEFLYDMEMICPCTGNTIHQVLTLHQVLNNDVEGNDNMNHIFHLFVQHYILVLNMSMLLWCQYYSNCPDMETEDRGVVYRV